MMAALSRYLVRPWAWWLNKVPLSITLVLLLLDGEPLSLRGALALVLVVATVCAVGNYGYALNDLFDTDEDKKTGRGNAAITLGRRRTSWITAVSALLALGFGGLAAGAAGAGLTLVELCLPLAYSMPPLRIKERKWLGVASDALAAHVYPAALALMTVRRLGLADPQVLVIACVLAWSLAAGLRGILSHQLHTADRDRAGGLSTVVHDLGRAPLERFVVFVLLPIEAVGFIGAVAGSEAGPALWAFGGLYLACEAYRTLNGGRFRVTALRPEGQPYLPLVEESFYKAWGPLVIAIDAARVDARFLIAPVLYAYLFRHHLRIETARLRAIWERLATRSRVSAP
jgi:4-hydroxybenzoate polyprenyltransferase